MSKLIQFSQLPWLARSLSILMLQRSKLSHERFIKTTQLVRSKPKPLDFRTSPTSHPKVTTTPYCPVLKGGAP